MGETVREAQRAGEGVRSLQRGLALLKAMNADPAASITRLAREVGVPRSTAYRLLDTLVAMGFVTPSSSNERYTLTREVYSLSRGFIDEEWIEDAWSEMVVLTERLIWPVDLLTSEGARMVVRRSTHPRSTLSIDYGMLGRRWPMTQSAAGRAYLAFCPAAERDVILDLPGIFEPNGDTPFERELVNRMLEQTRALGLGTRFGGMMPKTGSISAPVILDGTVLCCVSIIWIAVGLTLDRAVAELGPPLKDAAERVRRIALSSLQQSRPNQIGRA